LEIAAPARGYLAPIQAGGGQDGPVDK